MLGEGCQERASLEVTAIGELVFFMSRRPYDDDGDNAAVRHRKWNEKRRSRCWKAQSNLMLDFLHEIMDAALSENFYLANRESFN